MSKYKNVINIKDYISKSLFIEIFDEDGIRDTYIPIKYITATLDRPYGCCIELQFPGIDKTYPIFTFHSKDTIDKLIERLKDNDDNQQRIN